MTELRNFLKPDITFSQDLTAAALSYTTTLTRKFRLKNIEFHASVVITETITITRDSVNGAAYDTILRKKSLVGEQNYNYDPEKEIVFQAGDKIKITCTNANTTGTLYGTIKVQEA